MKTLLLWDIDGTLIDSGGAGERGLQLALKREFAIEDTLSWLEYFGRTDGWIARAILKHDLGEASPEDIQRFLNAYLKALAEEMNNPQACVLPGVAEIVAQIGQHSDIAQGLLTGNLRRGAEIKLGHLGLWAHFPYGAFANDAVHRDELGPHALRRANAYHGVTFVPERVFVIGDTPHDIACGKAIGARTFAVATGRYSSERLRAHTPTAVFENFADTGAFFAALN
ncbi:MAG: HAD hydrolase-like protein [Verrucomicrobia bacterium]|nr:HAD hydrolase-like protein [Verrucomicrobiota bacterium]